MENFHREIIMKAVLYLIAFFAFAIVSATFVVVGKRRYRKMAKDVYVLRETLFTVILGAALWSEAAVLLYWSFADGSRLFTSRNAVVNTVIFLLVSLLLGSFLMLYSLVKCYVFTQTGINAFDILGRKRQILFQDITKITALTGKRLSIETRSVKIILGGERRQMNETVKYLKKNCLRG
jgi:magnesium-transporting ATPase (P-type)